MAKATWCAAGPPVEFGAPLVVVLSAAGGVRAFLVRDAVFWLNAVVSVGSRMERHPPAVRDKRFDVWVFRWHVPGLTVLPAASGLAPVFPGLLSARTTAASLAAVARRPGIAAGAASGSSSSCSSSSSSRATRWVVVRVALVVSPVVVFLVTIRLRILSPGGVLLRSFLRRLPKRPPCSRRPPSGAPIAISVEVALKLCAQVPGRHPKRRPGLHGQSPGHQEREGLKHAGQVLGVVVTPKGEDNIVALRNF